MKREGVRGIDGSASASMICPIQPLTITAIIGKTMNGCWPLIGPTNKLEDRGAWGCRAGFIGGEWLSEPKACGHMHP